MFILVGDLTDSWAVATHITYFFCCKFAMHFVLYGHVHVNVMYMHVCLTVYVSVCISVSTCVRGFIITW